MRSGQKGLCWGLCVGCAHTVLGSPPSGILDGGVPYNFFSTFPVTPYCAPVLPVTSHYYPMRGVARRGLCAGWCARIGLHNLHKGCALFFSLLFFLLNIVYTYIHIYTCLHTYTYVYMYTYMYILTVTYMHAYMHSCPCIALLRIYIASYDIACSFQRC